MSPPQNVNALLKSVSGLSPRMDYMISCDDVFKSLKPHTFEASLRLVLSSSYRLVYNQETVQEHVLQDSILDYLWCRFQDVESVIIQVAFKKILLYILQDYEVFSPRCRCH